MASSSSLKMSGFTLLPESMKKHSTPVCSSSYESGYHSSGSSLPFTPFLNLNRRPYVTTPDYSPLLSSYLAPTDSLKQILFEEEDGHVVENYHAVTDISNDSVYTDSITDSPTKTSTPFTYRLNEQYLAQRFSERRQVSRPRCSYSLPYPGQEVGEQHVDFLRELGHYRNCQDIVARICGYLSCRDLHNACQVSHTWHNLVSAVRDRKTCTRRTRNHFEKENLHSREVKLVTPGVPEVRSSLASIGNRIPGGRVRLSPVKREHEKTTVPSRTALFQEQARKLLPCEHLQPCPRCQSPSRVTPQEKRARCTYPHCSFDYCTQCHRDFHAPTPCKRSALAGTRLRSPSKNDLIGSKFARRNLKRL